MQYAFFSATELQTYKVCLLVPIIRKEDIKKTYFDTSSLDPNDVLVMSLHYAEGKKKTPMPEMRSYIIEELAPVFKDMGVEYVICTDGEYFKALTKATKVEANLGYVLDSPFGDFKVVYMPSHSQIFYDPEKTKTKINQSINALVSHMGGTYQTPGNSIIEFAAYPQTDEGIEAWLIKLLENNKHIAADIEAFSLKHYSAGIGTITFCWSQTEGIAFPVDYVALPEPIDGLHGRQQINPHRRALLKKFFEIAHEWGIKFMWHSIGYDVGVLIYQLFMENILDYEGLLYGMKVMLGEQGDQWDCTKLITYLATNTCAGNRLGLKEQAQEYAGNYAQDEIEDIRKIPLAQLLQYNLVDGLSTWHVFNKHYPTMIADQQKPVYDGLFQPAMVDIIQMQLTGMPVNMPRVLEVEKILNQDELKAITTIRATKLVQRYTHRLVEEHVRKRNEKLVNKRISITDDECLAVAFNPNSAPQLQDLLFNFLGLPILGLTEAKQPSTDGDTLKALQFHTKDTDVLDFLKAMVDYKAVNKIITDFIPSLKNAQLGPDGWHYLFGNFNLGGTKSGRLSSSGPNLQNLPANSKYAKLIKSCFEAPPGWLFAGLDFDSLEDKISALTTKDPNKLKVYTDGYDGHCLRAFSYFGEKMNGIDSTSVMSINSIKDLYPDERQESKVPTFALTYMGTFITLMKNCGFSEEKAKLIEQRYHELYVVSDQWVASKLDQATKDGYVTCAFGLRLRTPLLHQVIRGTSKTPFQAEAEGRTAGNALGQSYCLLNSRAGIEFNGKVRKSQHRLSIKPCAHIHDAQYFIIKDDIEVIKYANDNLVPAVKWQEDPEIQHDVVKLGGKFGIFYPSWAKEIALPNDATEAEIFSVIDAAMSKGI